MLCVPPNLKGLIIKASSEQFRVFSKIIWYSNIITNFTFRIFIIIFNNKVNIQTWLYISRLHFDCALIFTIMFINYIIWSISLYIFGNWSHVFFEVLINPSATIDFPLLCTEYIFYITVLQQWFNQPTVKFIAFIHSYFIWFVIGLSRIFLKGLFIFQRNNSCIFTENINNTYTPNIIFKRRV